MSHANLRQLAAAVDRTPLRPPPPFAFTAPPLDACIDSVVNARNLLLL